ncbi:hypothetical protein HYZ41_03680 [archaeon]|nr:hypothetical protein [archaeon]
MRCLYGNAKIGENVVITPISLLYDKIISSFDSEETTNGWYRCAFVPEKNATIVKSHQGSSVADIAYSLGNHTEKVIHLGYCGGLGDVKLGDIIVGCESKHISEKERVFPSEFVDKPQIKYVKGKVLTVNNILFDENEESMKGYDAVDLETYWIYKFSPVPAVSIMLVTDLPGKIMFYDVSPDDPRLKSGIKNITDIFSYFLNGE